MDHDKVNGPLWSPPDESLAELHLLYCQFERTDKGQLQH